MPDDSPYTTGAIGLRGTKPSEEALESCDTLLIVGSSFPYIDFHPRRDGLALCKLTWTPHARATAIHLTWVWWETAHALCKHSCRFLIAMLNEVFLKPRRLECALGGR